MCACACVCVCMCAHGCIFSHGHWPPGSHGHGLEIYVNFVLSFEGNLAQWPQPEHFPGCGLPHISVLLPGGPQPVLQPPSPGPQPTPNSRESAQGLTPTGRNLPGNRCCGAHPEQLESAGEARQPLRKEQWPLGARTTVVSLLAVVTGQALLRPTDPTPSPGRTGARVCPEPPGLHPLQRPFTVLKMPWLSHPPVAKLLCVLRIPPSSRPASGGTA